MRYTAVFLLLLLLVVPALSDEEIPPPPKPLTPEQVADKVLEVVEAKDQAALKALVQIATSESSPSPAPPLLPATCISS